jgi:hypothetical protein
MDLTYDWQSFQAMFYPQRRSALSASGGTTHSSGSELTSPAYLVTEGETVVAAFAEGEDLSDWIGAAYADMAAEMHHRELLLFEREQLDSWLEESMTLPHLHEQVEFMRKKAAAGAVSTRAKPTRSKKGRKSDLQRKHGHVSLGHPHFLLEAMQGWWGKVLPSAYGVLIRLEGQGERDLFVVIRRGRIDSFHEPDLSSMGKDRRKVPADVVKYLSEKHLVPVQGIFVPATEWADWSDTVAPWRKVAASLKANQSRLVPFRWSLVSLMASRAFLGL